MKNIRALENAYHQANYDYGYTQPEVGLRTTRTLTCAQCGALFYIGNPEKSQRSRSKFQIAQRRANDHRDQSDHVIVFTVVDRRQ